MASGSSPPMDEALNTGTYGPSRHISKELDAAMHVQVQGASVPFAVKAGGSVSHPKRCYAADLACSCGQTTSKNAWISLGSHCVPAPFRRMASTRELGSALR
jgi:hypothetical protein